MKTSTPVAAVEVIGDEGDVTLAHGVQAKLWPVNAACPLFRWDGLEVAIEDSWFRGYELPLPAAPLYVRLLRRVFGGGPIHRAMSSELVCECSKGVGFRVNLSIHRFVVARWVLNAACCPQCGAIYLKELQEFHVVDVPLGDGPLG